MKKKFTFYTGLEYPNALVFGVLFLGISFYGIFKAFTIPAYNATHWITLLILIIPLSIGLFALSYNSVCIDIASNEMRVSTHYCLVFCSSETYNLSKIKRIRFKQVNANYSAGGEFLITAKNSFSRKEMNMQFFSSDSQKPYLVLEHLSQKSRSDLADFFTKKLAIEIIQAG